MNGSDRIASQSSAGVDMVLTQGASDIVQAPQAIWTATCLTAQAEHAPTYHYYMDEYRSLHEEHDQIMLRERGWLGKQLVKRKLEQMRQDMAHLRGHALTFSEEKWSVTEHNLVTTVGKNDLLDKYFAGSSYTATWYCGLVSSVSFSAYSAGDTMSSHAGWTEAGGTNAPNYSGANRPTLTFAAASGSSKSTSSASSFTFSQSGTIKGMFGTSGQVKDATSGVLYNAVNFTGGDRTVAINDVVNVNVTYSA